MSYNYGITKFDITNKINEKVRQFNASLSGNPQYSSIRTGSKFQLLLSDMYGASSPGFFKGRIERMKKVRKQSDITYDVSGRDNSLFLLKQPINFPCYKVTTSKLRERSFVYLLGRIIRGTGLTIGPEWDLLGQNFHNDKTESNWFCGEFKTKQEAINILLQRYLEVNDYKPDAYRWYVDVYGVVRVFNIYATNRPTLVFNQHKQDNLSLEIEENSEQIENDITYVGGENSEYLERLLNKESVERFGRRVGSPVQATHLKSKDKLKEFGKYDLKRKSEPIYVGTLNSVGYPQAEVGIGIKFPFDEDFGELSFTITGVTHTGSPGNYTTKLEFSTDEQVVVNPSWGDLIASIVKSSAPTNQPILAEVSAVDLSTGDVQFKPVGGVSKDILYKTVTISTNNSNLIAKKI